MKRIRFLCGILIVLNLPLLAQEQLGIRTSNFGGVNSLLLNPANSQTLPFNWDANLLEFGQFFSNNYAFIEDFRLLDVFSNPQNIKIRSLSRENQNLTERDVIVDFYQGDAQRRANILTQVMGPSFLYQLSETHSIGFFTRARMMLGAVAPAALGYYEYNNHPFDETFAVDVFSGSVLAWSEIGLNYAYHSLTSAGELSFGASLKILQGYEAGYIRNNNLFNLTQLRDNRLQGSAVDFQYGFASSGIETTDWQPQRNGGGLGLDLGMVYAFTDDSDRPYRWKLGLSLLDVGAIRFKQSAESHAIRTTDISEIIVEEFEIFQDISDLDEVARITSEQLLQDPNASLEDRAFTMQLPTALSIQADIALLPTFFVNATLVQPVSISKIAVRRTSIAAITPRFESPWFELAVPISVLDWQSFRAGASVRLAFFYLGTEDLGSIFQKQENFDSTDFYLAIKLNPFGFGNGNALDKSRGKSNVKCPAW